MKKILIISFFLGAQIAKAQCTVDAGNDIVLCNDYMSKKQFIQIKPTINSLYPIKSILWHVDTLMYNKWYYQANNFLSSIYIANPIIIQPPFFSPDKNLGFIYLEITDSLNNTCRDSFKFYISTVKCSDAYLTIKRGDTIKLSPRCWSDWDPNKILWKKTDFILDTDSFHARMFPPYSKVYYYTLTDSLGCIADSLGVFLKVDTISSKLLDNNTPNVQLIPSLISDNTMIIIDPNNFSNCFFELWDEKGLIIERKKYIDTYPIGHLLQNPGLYFLRIFNNNNVLLTKRLIKQ